MFAFFLTSALAPIKYREISYNEKVGVQLLGYGEWNMDTR